jgi:hypothetical protein
MPSEFWGHTNLFGIRISFRSDHRDALRSALSVFAKWNCSEQPAQEASIYIVLSARDADRTMSSDHVRIRGPHLSIVHNGMALRANGNRGRGACIFPPREGCGGEFREAIHTIVLFLVAHAGRTPVHASAIIIGDQAIVMAGRSRSGKSSLSLAADRAGLPVLSEDCVFIQTEPSFCVWALAEAIHLHEADAPAGLAGGVRVRFGRVKRVLPIAQPRHKADKASLCVIARGDSVGLEKIRQDEAVRMLTEAPEPGFEYYGGHSERAIRAIAAGGCWRLILSRDPDEAIAALIAAFSEHGSDPQSVERSA